MLNRRYLRIKAYQSLYAFWQSEDGSAANIEKELFKSIEHTYDLYISLLQLFGEMHQRALDLIEERKLKRLPSPEDLSPNLRFIQNPVLLAIVNSPLLKAETEQRKQNWMGHKDLLDQMFRRLIQNPIYTAYMAEEGSDLLKDRRFVIQMFVDAMANFEAIQDMYEARSIHWLEDLDLASGMVKRTIEQIKEKPDGDIELAELYNDPEEEREFLRLLYRKCIEQSDEHAAAIAKQASNWESDRIALTDMILMKMALTEVRTFPMIPVKVTMNEYIEVAKAYSTPKSKNFINGILDNLFAQMKKDGKINKVGRGLIEN